MNLLIDTTKKDDKSIVSLGGELDIYTAPELKEKLLKAISDEDRLVEIDLERVSYMDSTGIGVFINALKAATAKEINLKLINLQDRVMRLFKITGLEEVINIESANRGGNENGNV